MRKRSQGFTLVEVMVAIGILALVAVLSWRGLDGMMRAQNVTQQRADQVVLTQTALAQWRADLNAVVQVPGTAALDWDGLVLRVTRRNIADPGVGLLVVGWSQRLVDGRNHWMRWQSPPLRTRGDLQAAVQRVAAWARNPGDDDRRREMAVLPVAEWQVLYFRGNAWTSALSSAGTVTNTTTSATGAITSTQDVALPDGVRLLLTLPEAHPLAGRLTLDWNRPTLSGGKS